MGSDNSFFFCFCCCLFVLLFRSNSLFTLDRPRTHLVMQSSLELYQPSSCLSLLNVGIIGWETLCSTTYSQINALASCVQPITASYLCRYLTWLALRLQWFQSSCQGYWQESMLLHLEHLILFALWLLLSLPSPVSCGITWQLFRCGLRTGENKWGCVYLLTR